MNTEQEIKSIQANLDRLYSELNGVKGMVLKLAQLPDGIIGNSSDSPYVKSDNSDPNHYMPKVGEVVLVGHYGNDWQERISTGYNDSEFPFACVNGDIGHIEKYRKGKPYETITWRYCRRLNGEIIEFGCDAKQPERKEAEQPNPYAVDWTNAPDWADVHCFEKNTGYWIGVKTTDSGWKSLESLSNFILPAGLDWKLSKTFRPR